MASGADGDNVTPVGWSGTPAPGASSRGSRKTATPAELASMLTKVFGGLSTLLALWVGEDEVALEREEAEAIAEPAARLLGRAKVAKRIAKQLAGASDGIDLAFALALYGLRISPYVAQKVGNRARPTDTSPVREATAQQRSPEPGANNGASPNGHVSGTVPGGYAAYGEPSEAGHGINFGGGIRPIW